MTVPVFRFAPSSNGALHLGHAYSAMLNYRLARKADGRFLLRIEDIDTSRCSPEREQAIYRDLEWLGIEWELPVRRQSDHFEDYRAALDRLEDANLIYPSFMTRGDLRAFIAEAEAEGTLWPRDPDGAPLFPSLDRERSPSERKRLIANGAPFAWRLDIENACAALGHGIDWDEEGAGPQGQTGLIPADPRAWGDVVIARKETPTSYHLAVTVDDAVQGITHVVRGRDLFFATAVHRLIQELMGLPVPRYHHHALIRDLDGRKLSKSQGDTGIAALRQAGATPADIARMVGLDEVT
ncbi:tRNA glutamyl-Q(34) synthetase GluQRS [Nitratireductor luteus]|uniref:tRNA glutamyl-Q(34) synthetase GluQRS n=1 Tax=Nitratireductor luteus TaxID=2976980 RepID=UPI00223F08A5|nr:tRNA glutamyl-Q(34) synthetase GluQRS [Nitratireductor luteus]